MPYENEFYLYENEPLSGTRAPGGTHFRMNDLTIYFFDVGKRQLGSGLFKYVLYSSFD